VIGGLALNAFASGVAGIPFLEITSKTVPVEQRGAFFGGRRVMGGGPRRFWPGYSLPRCSEAIPARCGRIRRVIAW
jgi:hypothetical protein